MYFCRSVIELISNFAVNITRPTIPTFDEPYMTIEDLVVAWWQRFCRNKSPTKFYHFDDQFSLTHSALFAFTVPILTGLARSRDVLKLIINGFVTNSKQVTFHPWSNSAGFRFLTKVENPMGIQAEGDIHFHGRKISISELCSPRLGLK